MCRKSFIDLQTRIVREGLCHFEVAEAALISKSTFSNRINGNSEFTAAEMARIGGLLGIAHSDYYDCFIAPFLAKNKITVNESEVAHV